MPEINNGEAFKECRITSWKQFAREVRSRGGNLLARLDEFPNSVLITGCQRSGTTILSRVITQSEGMTNYWFGKDDELDAALILSSSVQHAPVGRYCFQTTYLNECVHEYYTHANGHRIIWVLRNPLSVVYSMLYNWKNFALNELFLACGIHLLTDKEKRLYRWFGVRAISRLRRACLSYNGKVSQAFDLAGKLPANFKLVEYEDLVLRKEKTLPPIYEFIDLPYNAKYLELIHTRSLNKCKSLSKMERTTIEKVCMPVYHAAKMISYQNQRHDEASG